MSQGFGHDEFVVSFEAMEHLRPRTQKGQWSYPGARDPVYSQLKIGSKIHRRLCAGTLNFRLPGCLGTQGGIQVLVTPLKPSSKVTWSLVGRHWNCVLYRCKGKRAWGTHHCFHKDPNCLMSSWGNKGMLSVPHVPKCPWDAG